MIARIEADQVNNTSSECKENTHMNNKEIQKAFLNGEYSFTLNKVHTADRITVHDKMPPEENKEVYDFVAEAILTYKKTRRGTWIQDKRERRDDGEIYDYCCSLCKSPAAEGSYGNHDVLTPYCSQCGAEMINGRKDD